MGRCDTTHLQKCMQHEVKIVKTCHGETDSTHSVTTVMTKGQCLMHVCQHRSVAGNSAVFEENAIQKSICSDGTKIHCR